MATRTIPLSIQEGGFTTSRPGEYIAYYPDSNFEAFGRDRPTKYSLKFNGLSHPSGSYTAYSVRIKVGGSWYTLYSGTGSFNTSTSLDLSSDTVSALQNSNIEEIGVFPTSSDISKVGIIGSSDSSCTLTITYTVVTGTLTEPANLKVSVDNLGTNDSRDNYIRYRLSWDAAIGEGGTSGSTVKYKVIYASEVREVTTNSATISIWISNLSDYGDSISFTVCASYSNNETYSNTVTVKNIRLSSPPTGLTITQRLNDYYISRSEDTPTYFPEGSTIKLLYSTESSKPTIENSLSIVDISESTGISLPISDTLSGKTVYFRLASCYLSEHHNIVYYNSDIQDFTAVVPLSISLTPIDLVVKSASNADHAANNGESPVSSLYHYISPSIKIDLKGGNTSDRVSVQFISIDGSMTSQVMSSNVPGTDVTERSFIKNLNTVKIPENLFYKEVEYKFIVSYCGLTIESDILSFTPIPTLQVEVLEDNLISNLDKINIHIRNLKLIYYDDDSFYASLYFRRYGDTSSSKIFSYRVVSRKVKENEDDQIISLDLETSKSKLISVSSKDFTESDFVEGKKIEFLVAADGSVCSNWVVTEISFHRYIGFGLDGTWVFGYPHYGIDGKWVECIPHHSDEDGTSWVDCSNK